MRGFKQAYENIKNGQRAQVRSAIMASCKWDSLPLFSMKKNGQRRLTADEARNIKAVFANVGIHARTGRPMVEPVKV